MTCKTLFLALRRAALCACLVFSLAVFAVPAHADDVPKFSDPAVTEYCKKFAVLADDMVKAVKTKDEAKANSVMGAMSALQGDAAVIGTKLKPEEVDAFTKFMEAQATKIQKSTD